MTHDDGTIERYRRELAGARHDGWEDGVRDAATLLFSMTHDEDAHLAGRLLGRLKGLASMTSLAPGRIDPATAEAAEAAREISRVWEMGFGLQAMDDDDDEEEEV